MSENKLTQQDIMDYNTKLYELIRQYAVISPLHTTALLKEKNRLNPSIAMQDHKKISYFVDKKIKQLQEMGQDQISSDFGSTSIYNPKLREKHCIMGKTGKFFKHLFPDLEPSTIQEMVAKWYCIVNQSQDNDFKFSLEKDIQFYYHQDRSLNERGALGSSCMKYKECQGYLEFYSNYDVSLLVLKNSSNIIKGRALIWHNLYFESLDKTLDFMDRIYINDDNDFELFKAYADKHDLVERNGGYNFMYQGDETRDTVVIKPINKHCSDTFPYLDTFMYMNGDNELSNNDDNGDFYIELDCTNGNNSESYLSVCSDCGERFNEENEGTHIEHRDGSICGSCLENYYFYCNDCDQYHSTDDQIEIHRENTWNTYVCSICADHNYHQCVECDIWIDSDSYFSHNDDSYCHECYNDNIFCCEKCEDEFHNCDLENGLCFDCIEEIEQEKEGA